LPLLKFQPSYKNWGREKWGLCNWAFHYPKAFCYQHHSKTNIYSVKQNISYILNKFKNSYMFRLQ